MDIQPILTAFLASLRLDGERRSKGPGQRGQQEAAAVHAEWWGLGRIAVKRVESSR